MRFLFMKVTGNWFLGTAFVCRLDVNAEHIVPGHNGILRLQTETMMDSLLSATPQANKPRNNKPY